MTAHALIPSAVATRTISEKWSLLRLPLYAFGILSIVGMCVALALAAYEAEPFITRIYPRYWQ